MNLGRKTLAMEYAPFDSSGTDDDLPQSHLYRGTRGHITGNRQPALGALPYPRVQIDMESQIHWLEQEAYCSVLKAFKAQADSISWEKNDLMNNLRRELRISDEEYSELKSRVDADDIVGRIREWRRASGSQSVLLNNAPAYDSVVSPSASVPRKRQMTSHSIASLAMSTPSSVLHAQPDAATSLSLRGASIGAKGKKLKPGHNLPGVPMMKSLQIPPTVPSGMGPATNRSCSGSFTAKKPLGAVVHDPLIGQKVMTRWPEDNNFYEAEIACFSEMQGKHALIYDKNTNNETWEWVNLKEIPPGDIRWEREDPVLFDRIRQASAGGGINKPADRNATITGAGRGRGSLGTDLVPPTNVKKRTDDIEILHTETLVNEVEKVFAAAHPDPVEIEKAKKMLQEHEQSLIDVIASLADASDSESEEGKDDTENNRNGDNAEEDVIII